MNDHALPKLLAASLVTLLAVACDVEFIAGPSLVQGGERVQYQILVRPQDNNSATNATVHLAGDVPIGWALDTAQFQASIGGGASGDLTVYATDPGVITGLPAVPTGHRRIYLSAGPFTTITADDAGTALLTFIAAGAAGSYTMTFWAGVTGQQNDPDLFFSKPLTVTPPPPANTIFADGFAAGTVERWSRRVGGDASTVAFLPLDGDADDESSYANHGTAIGGPTATADRFGTPGAALLFDGDDDQIIIAHSPSLNLREAATLAAWIRPAPTGNHYVVGKINLSGSGFLYALDYVQGPAASRIRDALGEAWNAEGYLPIQPEEWQLLVFTWDGQHLLCYVDGRLEGFQAPTTAAIGTNEGDVEIGSYEDARYRGVIDEVLIMNRALTFREVQMMLP
ncbi:MAG: hypothetical protein C3F15_01205, partial [Holophagae bacterium]